MRGVNYDHTILGWRGALRLTPHLSKERSLLPTVQAMWYAPQGLNIWEQIICEFPGHYAALRRSATSVTPATIQRSIASTGRPGCRPRSTSRTTSRSTAASVDEGIGRLLNAIAEGDRAESYGLLPGSGREPGQSRASQGSDPLRRDHRLAGHADQPWRLPEHRPQGAPRPRAGATSRTTSAGTTPTRSSTPSSRTSAARHGCYGLWTEVSNIVKIELGATRQDPEALEQAADRAASWMS